ncbi:MAG: hypothetical protein PVH16_07880 [Thioalkalispiraceae bacterium]|jgi:uncharacterized protein (DUF302 family)
MKSLLSLLIAGLLSFQVQATDLYMSRSPISFPETMLKLQDTIKSLGYKVSRVQRVDIGLTTSGYKTDKYRVVFYGKTDEVISLSKKYPHLVPYLPLKIAIFAEGEETLLVSPSPLLLNETNAPELQPVLAKWEKDLATIMARMRAE